MFVFSQCFLKRRGNNNCLFCELHPSEWSAYSALMCRTAAAWNSNEEREEEEVPRRSHMSFGLSYWDYLPPEIVEYIMMKLKKDLAEAKDYKARPEIMAIHQQLDNQPRCNLYGTVSTLFYVFCKQVLLKSL